MSSFFNVRARHIVVPCQPHSALVSSTLSPGPDNQTFCFSRDDFNRHTKFHRFNKSPSYDTFIKILAMYLAPRFHLTKTSWYSLYKRLRGLTSKVMAEFVTSEHNPKSILRTPWIRSSFKRTRPSEALKRHCNYKDKRPKQPDVPCHIIYATQTARPYNNT
jgi:hypothetical protein